MFGEVQITYLLFLLTQGYWISFVRTYSSFLEFFLFNLIIEWSSSLNRGRGLNKYEMDKT